MAQTAPAQTPPAPTAAPTVPAVPDDFRISRAVAAQTVDCAYLEAGGAGNAGAMLRAACEREAATSHAVIRWAATADVIAFAASHPDGLPILLKDNIETRDMPTTAGSLALAHNAPGRDAPLVARLRASGYFIMGKANLSEWANIRSSNSISGWSAVGGLTPNPHDPARTACGSSSGSAVAVAVGLAPVAIGTETNGSITCPASVNGVVGFKPTVGLVSRTHIVPISHSQDTAGPIATTVADAARVLTVIAGTDAEDAATAEADAHKTDYAAALDAGSLNGVRIGVLRYAKSYSAPTLEVFERNLQVLRDAGAVLVDIDTAPDLHTIGAESFKVLMYELKADLNAYLASTDAAQVPSRTLADLIAFNSNSAEENALFGQELFLQAEAKGDLTTQEYVDARATSFRLAGPEGIDRMMADNSVVALIAPTTSRAWTNARDDDDNAQGSTSTIAAVAGYPHLTVPMGFDRDMPIGLSFIGGKWDDAKILSLGYAFEQKTHARRAPGEGPAVE
ncbi:amidase [Brevundimonas goettingensis]|uniref:Amidase n=2 Tax=Brevundimonas goettingensis TaxID=2774190 RepID=A0A975GX53_9CAUL|nr:amidase [Brevundimonas goettingensis]